MKFITLISLFFLPFFVLADGDCHLVVNGNGDYEIVCNGSGIFVENIIRTNELCNCSLQDCEDLKNDLLSACSGVQANLDLTFDYLIQTRMYLYQALDELSNPDLFTNVNVHGAIASLNTSISRIEDSFGYLDSVRPQFDVDSSNSLYSTVRNIECGECASGGGEGGGGGCCDFSSILDILNGISYSLEDITSHFDFSDRTAFSTRFLIANISGRPTDPSLSVAQSYSFNPTETYFSQYLIALQKTISNSLPSLNNYFWYFTHRQVQPFLDELHHKSFMYYAPSGFTFTNYYSYVTNFYLRSALGQLISNDGELQGYTNWFDRVEALLAALVFSDSSSTNSVDSNYGSSEKSQIISSLSSISQSPSVVLNQVDQVGQGIVQSLNQMNSSFSRFASGPNQVTLVSLGVNQSVSFESSEIIYLVNACRCITTLVWTFGGLWILFAFVYWCFKQSYNLFIFCWSVCSSIFGGRK